MEEFTFAHVPPVYFGSGKISGLPELAHNFGQEALLVTGNSSLRKSGLLERINELFRQTNMYPLHVSIGGEPRVGDIDDVCNDFREKNIKVVIGIGGGSVIDGAKAISAMLPHSNSVFDHLEGMEGSRPHNGEKVPFIALPSTAGTGAEMTKNAVISMPGENGYKRSLRHDNFIPDVVIVDPELSLSCPFNITAACGMDAFTQLLESYVSSAGNSLTDALSFSGMARFVRSLIPACTGSHDDLKVRADLAYGAMLSGITLVNTGLGVVHGLAGPIGGFFDIPHGVICGALVWPANKVTVEALRERAPDSHFLKKYAAAGALLYPAQEKSEAFLCDALLSWLEALTEELKIPGLASFGLEERHLNKIVSSASNRNNPIRLETEEMFQILERGL
ncbi:iron-containing alcohol dehydrogenase [Fibrobacterota bacterium]